jgi:uncharacterized protein (TIGR03435 family)
MEVGVHQPFKRAIKMIAILSLALYGENEAPGPAFEVASIKPAPPITAAMAAAGKMHYGVKIDKAQVDIGYTSLAGLIRIAYKVEPYQIAGPDWMPVQQWDIIAKLPDGASSEDMPKMLQALLVDRFKLQLHREKRQCRVYALDTAKNGPNLRESPPDETQADPTQPDKPLQVQTKSDKTTVSGGGAGITTTEMRPDGSMHLVSSKMTLSMLAKALSFYTNRPVIDATGLKGNYRMELDFSAKDLRDAAAKSGAAAMAPQPAAGADDAAELPAESLLASVRQLGLKLESRQMQIEMLVIDHLEKAPTAN